MIGVARRCVYHACVRGADKLRVQRPPRRRRDASAGVRSRFEEAAGSGGHEGCLLPQGVAVFRRIPPPAAQERWWRLTVDSGRGERLDVFHQRPVHQREVYPRPLVGVTLLRELVPARESVAIRAVERSFRYKCFRAEQKTKENAGVTTRYPPKIMLCITRKTHISSPLTSTRHSDNNAERRRPSCHPHPPPSDLSSTRREVNRYSGPRRPTPRYACTCIRPRIRSPP